MDAYILGTMAAALIVAAIVTPVVTLRSTASFGRPPLGTIRFTTACVFGGAAAVMLLMLLLLMVLLVAGEVRDEAAMANQSPGLCIDAICSCCCCFAVVAVVAAVLSVKMVGSNRHRHN